MVSNRSIGKMKVLALITVVLLLLSVSKPIFSTYEGYESTKELHIRLDEQDTGTGDAYDDSVNNHSVTESWTNSDGFYADSYNSLADSCGRFINDTAGLDIPHHTTLQRVDAASGFYFTLVLWFKYITAPQNSYVFLVRKRNAYEVELHNDSSTSYEVKIKIEAQRSETTWSMFTTSLLNPNSWYFVVYEVNTTGYQKIWINGVADNEQDIGGIVTSDAAYNFLIGFGAGNNLNDVLIDDVIFYYNTTFTQAYIEWLYENMPYLNTGEIPVTTTTTTTTTTVDTGVSADFPLKDGEYFAAIPVQSANDNLEDLLLLSLVVVSSAIAFAIGRRRK